MLKTYLETIYKLDKLVRTIKDALHEDLLNVLVEVAVQDGVGDG